MSENLSFLTSSGRTLRLSYVGITNCFTQRDQELKIGLNGTDKDGKSSMVSVTLTNSASR
jgi:hypothetical protein